MRVLLSQCNNPAYIVRFKLTGAVPWDDFMEGVRFRLQVTLPGATPTTLF